MKKLVIIGANDFQNELIIKAKSLGYETHVFSFKFGFEGEENADYFYPISIFDKERILDECKKINPVGVCSIASDFAVETVNYVTENLGLPGNPTSITAQCTNKYIMREKFKQNGIKVPKYIRVSNKKSTWNVDNMNFPLIVKPTDSAGSRAITKIDTKEEMEYAITKAISESEEKKAIIEEYIDGDEYSCECISFEGEHYFIAFTKKYTTGSPNFIEIGHEQPSNIESDLQDEIKDNIFKALDTLGIKNGASHTEFKINKSGEMTIIEIGSRMASGCIGTDLVKLSTGYDYVKMTIDVACGKKPQFDKKSKTKRAIIKFILNNSDIDEMNKLINSNNDIYKVSKMNLENIGKVIDNKTRVGYYIYVTNN